MLGQVGMASVTRNRRARNLIRQHRPVLLHKPELTACSFVSPARGPAANTAIASRSWDLSDDFWSERESDGGKKVADVLQSLYECRHHGRHHAEPDEHRAEEDCVDSAFRHVPHDHTVSGRCCAVWDCTPGRRNPPLDIQGGVGGGQREQIPPRQVTNKKTLTQLDLC
jgi:hypothetical protein